MNFLLRLFPDFAGGRPALGLLIFRVVTGVALMLHGWSKVQNPMSWMGPDGPPAFLQALAAFGEFGGGLMLALGLLTPIACVWVAAVMIGALSLVHIPNGDPWVGGRGGSMENAISYLVACVLLFCTGPGKISIDSRIFGKRVGKGLEPVERKEPANVA
jgi:putative oxidoreductase